MFKFNLLYHTSIVMHGNTTTTTKTKLAKVTERKFGLPPAPPVWQWTQVFNAGFEMASLYF
jgi:hypothetical protein